MKTYEEGFHDGALTVLQDLMKNIDAPASFIASLEAWADKLEITQPRRVGGRKEPLKEQRA